MTSKGLVVVEHEEDTSSAGHGHPPPPSLAGSDGPPGLLTRKSPIAELLYMRWLEGLKLKWPNLLGS